jgi:diguanylate cyclase
MPSHTIPDQSGQLLQRVVTPRPHDNGVPRDPSPRRETLSTDRGNVRATPPLGTDRVRDLRFVHRIHGLRALGSSLGALCVASVLHLHDDPIGWWLLLGLNGLIWPHIALLLATRSPDPRRSEMRNLMVDSGFGGIWIAVMQFNLLPSVLLLTMLSIDKVSVGGVRLMARTLVLLATTCVLTSAALGFPLDIATPVWVVVASVPFLMLYPLAISAVAFGLARKVAHQNRLLDELGHTDGLTGLGNRRQFFAVAESELERHRRTGRPAALVIMDIDHFKTINDRFGHPVGDDVLCAVAEILRHCCRTPDTPARYGGDEFVLLLPETDEFGAAEVAHRIRSRLATLVLEHAPDLRCTVSLGAAEATRAVTSVDLWIAQADAALYRAKAAGRDRFEGAARA